MFTDTYVRFIPVLLAGWLTGTAWAQSPFDPGRAGEASRIREQILLFTDRNLYAVDEQIYFAADRRISGPVGESAWSSVLYVELVASNGQRLAQGKYRISEGRAEGSLHIPAESMTGNYYLKCYTRWMRNTGPESYSYVPLKVINPFRAEVAGTTNDSPSGLPAHRISYQEKVLECNTGTLSYEAGQEAELFIKGATLAGVNHLRCCVTVVPKGAIELDKGQLELTGIGNNQPFQVNWLPDLGDNISISGTVVGRDQEPVPYATLHFSLLGEDPDYFAALSDEHGKFVISTPTDKGEYKEFFVTPEQDMESDREVRIDQEYDNGPLCFSVDAFGLTEPERELARKTALNMQLSKVYVLDDSSQIEPPEQRFSEGGRIPFYGTDVNRLLIDDYVKLPNLEEVFLNLIPEVQFYRKQGRNRIRILSDNSSIGIYNPLIMIDHISVFDHEALMALSPEKIERIDLINDIYLKGNVTFGGVLAIHSRKGDMAGIDLPRGSYFFDYQSFHASGPMVASFPALEARIPDTRNTLHWSPDLLLEEGDTLELRFRVPSAAGPYMVLVRAVLPDGQVIAASSEFTVK